MLSIGHIPVDSSLVLAPMAGISDLPFRMINRSFGCGLAFTEMISAKSLINNSRKTLRMISVMPDDRPLGLQILGYDPETISRAMDFVSQYPFDLIDFNAACPVNKVVSKIEGAGLLREPDRFQELLTVIVRNTNLPVTVKIRSGWDQTSLNAVEIALRAQDAGVKALTIHGRTRMQGYSGTVDYNIIREVKAAVQIPVIASGDAFSPQLIKKMFCETGCDGVAIARGSLGNPWIFREASGYLRDGTVPSRPKVREVGDVMRRHLSMLAEYRGEKSAVIVFRKFFSWYTKGMAVKEFKRKAFRAEDIEGMTALIEDVEGCMAADTPVEATVV
ncbi:MAG TPA: tRNA dihydrouridine synthase DusB [Thermodesulfovibrionales bacterium]|nr:tRNA dihydrouridine synthase DusB [Thermodesulfovibrionales bacterium]